MLFIKRLSRNDLESLLHASSIPIEAITQKLPAAMKTITQQLAVPMAKALREGDTGLFDMLSPELQVCDTTHINSIQMNFTCAIKVSTVANLLHETRASDMLTYTTCIGYDLRNLPWLCRPLGNVYDGVQGAKHEGGFFSPPICNCSHSISPFSRARNYNLSSSTRNIDRNWLAGNFGLAFLSMAYAYFHA